MSGEAPWMAPLCAAVTDLGEAVTAAVRAGAGTEALLDAVGAGYFASPAMRAQVARVLVAAEAAAACVPEVASGRVRFVADVHSVFVHWPEEPGDLPVRVDEALRAGGLRLETRTGLVEAAMQLAARRGMPVVVRPARGRPVPG